MFYRKRKSIIIKYRKPKVVIVEALLLWLVLLQTSLKFDPAYYKYISCPGTLIPSVTIATVCIILAIIRMSYLFGVVLDIEKRKEFGLGALNSVFWAGNSIKKRNCGVIIFLGGFLSFAYSLLWYILSNKMDTTYESGCHWKPALMAYILNLIAFILCFCFAIQLLRHKVKDRIGMSKEVILNMLCLFLVILIYFIAFLFGKNNVNWLAFTESCVNIFFCLYFPIFQVYFFNKHTSLNKGKVDTLIIPQDYDLPSICRQYLCEEIVFFLQSYDKYKKGLATFEEMRDFFIIPGSPMELNIDFEVKKRIMRMGYSQIEKEESFNEVYSLICLQLKQIIQHAEVIDNI